MAIDLIRIVEAAYDIEQTDDTWLSAILAAAARTRAPDQAIEEWKGLIAARWTLLDVRESDGRKYLVARENQARTAINGLRTRRLKCLTDRERQVASLAALGQHNKLIAYNLGISHSTVRVLVARAAAKLRAKSRSDLIRCVLAGESPG